MYELLEMPIQTEPQVQINQSEIEIEVLINQHTPSYYFANNFTVETKWDSARKVLTLAPQFKMLSEAQNSIMPVFEISFEHNIRPDVIDLYNCNVRSDYFLCSYDKQTKEFICLDECRLSISDVEKHFSYHIEEITKNWNERLGKKYGMKKRF